MYQGAATSSATPRPCQPSISLIHDRYSPENVVNIEFTFEWTQREGTETFPPVSAMPTGCVWGTTSCPGFPIASSTTARAISTTRPFSAHVLAFPFELSSSPIRPSSHETPRRFLFRVNENLFRPLAQQDGRGRRLGLLVDRGLASGGSGRVLHPRLSSRGRRDHQPRHVTLTTWRLIARLSRSSGRPRWSSRDISGMSLMGGSARSLDSITIKEVDGDPTWWGGWPNLACDENDDSP